MATQNKDRSPWTWIPTLYFFQGIPYSIVMITSGLIYKTMGISIASFAFWTSLLVSALGYQASLESIY